MTSISRWPLRTPAAAVGLLALALTLSAATICYDLTNYDALFYVRPDEAANRNGAVDLGIQVVIQVTLAVCALSVAGLLLCMVGLLRGRRWAHVTTCILATPYALCGGLTVVNDPGSFSSQPQHASAPAWVRVGDALAPPLVVAAAIVTLILLFVPVVHRRFHPPQIPVRRS
ncbi:hypothetical protein AB0B86_14330 [Micromonospora sp. NPDC049047]|uniref:hypothetical protein n=1 Tax=Micromonospora sp. NPDC049047 TaxID=3155645 RepID=UPI0033F0C6D2